MTKRLNDDALNFVNGGLFTNPRKIEKKKLEIYLKKSHHKKKELTGDKNSNFMFDNN